MELGGDVDEPADENVERAVRQLLTNDEARWISVVALVLAALGLVFSVLWVFVMWRTQSELSGSDRSFSSVGGGLTGDDPDVVDRIIAVVQIGPILMLSLLTFASGCGLRLFAGRLLSQRSAIDDLDAPSGDDAGLVHEVTLQPDDE